MMRSPLCLAFSATTKWWPSLCRLLTVLRNELGHAVRRLRAFAEPMIDSAQIELQTTLFALRHRVEEPYLLEGRAALADAAVGHHHVIKRLIFTAATGQTNRNHALVASKTPATPPAAKNGARIVLKLLRK